jgi:YidC/Oxa1 family membrane protein insertase
MVQSLAHLLAPVLARLAGVVGSYGAAVVSLALLFRLLVLPLLLAQGRWTQRVQSLQPRVQQINQKYGTDLMARQQATAALYRSTGTNQLTGCWLVLALFLVNGLAWIALYGLIPTAPEFHARFLWLSDLSQPSDRRLFGHAFAYYIIPALLLVLPLIQSRIAARRVGGWTPWPLAILALFVPSGLSLFWLTGGVFDLLLALLLIGLEAVGWSVD